MSPRRETGLRVNGRNESLAIVSHVGRSIVVLLGLTLVFVVHSRRTYIRNYTGGGDSPYYVLMARSLARDFDLVLGDGERSLQGNFEDCPIPLPPRIVSPERPYCWHPIGAPLLFALPYALAGRLGILVFTALLAGATLGLLWFYTRQIQNDPIASLVAVSIIGLSIPYLPLAANEYTEIPALFFQVLGLIALQRLDSTADDRGSLLFLGLSAGFLPWIHMRYVWISMALCIAALARRSTGHRPLASDTTRNQGSSWTAPCTGSWWRFVEIIRQRRRLEPVVDSACESVETAASPWAHSPSDRSFGWLLVPIGISIVGLFAWGYHVTGELHLTTPLRLSGANEPRSLGVMTLVTKGLWGHLTDQQGGLLIHAPQLFIGVLGFLSPSYLLRRELVVHLLYAVPTFFTVAGYYNWSGHWGLPCRFLATLLPLICLGWTRVVQLAREHFPLCLFPLAPPLAAGAMLSVLYLYVPPLQLSLEANNVNLDSLFVYLYRHLNVDLLTAFPRFIYTPTPRDYALAVSLLGVACVWLYWTYRVLTGRSWRLWGAFSVWMVTLHFVLVVVTRPAGSPLAEDPRWAALDTEFLLSYPRFYPMVAVDAMKKGRIDVACRALERRLKVQPRHLETHAWLAELYRPSSTRLFQEHWEEGMKIARDTLEIDREARFYRGVLHQLSGNEAAATTDFEEYLKRPGARAKVAAELLSRLRDYPKNSRVTRPR